MNVYNFSGCLTEHDIDYRGNDVNDGPTNLQPDVESCRSVCKSMAAGYFTFHKGNNACWCKSSNAGRKETVGKVSGETCSGEK